MKYIFKNILPYALTAGILLGGCAEKLDVKPVNTIDSGAAVATSGDVEALLVGAYDALGDADVLGGNIQRDADLLGDNGEIFFDGTFVAPDQIFRKSLLVNNDQAETTWLDAYRAVNVANNVLANLEVVTDEKRDRVEGEAKFIRGLLYFSLINSYAQTWLDGTPSANLGVPLVLEPTNVIDEQTKVSRNSVAEVYTQLIKDLTEAEAKLPASNGFFATNSAAAAILSRVYLMQGKFPEAAEAATRVIDAKKYALVDIQDVFDQRINVNGINSPEDIFAIQNTSQDASNALNTFYGASEYGGRGDILIEDAHLALYDAKDKRAGLFYEGENGNVYSSKWINQYGNVKIVRLAEMYLTRAEANFRSGTSVGAAPAADLNLVRARAGLAALPAASLTLPVILKERHLELAFEGQLINDLKRNKLSVGTLPFSSPKLVFPIPRREIDANGNLVQNPGY